MDRYLRYTNAVSNHTAIVIWQKEPGSEFLKGKYSRAHRWEFDGGAIVPASPSPSIVPLPFSSESAVDPEEAFVASVSSCHMLWFLFLAASKGLDLESYRDGATGVLTKNENGIPWISEIVLNPQVVYGPSTRPTPSQEAAIHHEAHQRCFIANSIRSRVTLAGFPFDETK